MNNDRLTALLNLDKSALPADGGAAFNRLIFARSPYLLQHADNPVDWREWGAEAFAEARERDVPLLVSIGYATCHWCHVMAVESFSDSEIAAQINRSFVAIKVDREERPDLDDYYMTAARALTGSGGWPLNLFVDHDRRPFFAITYLPKHPRQQTPGFLNLLTNLATLWQKRRALATSNAEEIDRAVAALAATPEPSGKDIGTVASAAEKQLTELFDLRFGGFGSGVKFPMATYLLFLLDRNRTAAPQSLVMVEQTLATMAQGGINDQLGGGFHRYAVDRQWQIPHFEKMLYDQALLITVYVEAYRANGNRSLLETATRTAAFVVKELLESGGGFAAGLDADSEGEEGRYYTWSLDELTDLLGDDLPILGACWGVTAAGNLDGRSVLQGVPDPAAFAATRGMNIDQLTALINRGRERLLAARDRREAPLRDPKVICAWNGLMISALVRLSTVSNDRSWLRQAAATARFVMAEMVTSTGRLVRNWLGTPAPVPAFAEDYVYFCLGLADLQVADQDPVWREALERFGNDLLRLFIDGAGNVAWCGTDTESLPLQIAPVQDGVMPSTAGSCAILLLRMGALFDEERYTEAAAAVIRRYRGVVEQNPAACLSLIQAEELLSRLRLDVPS